MPSTKQQREARQQSKSRREEAEALAEITRRRALRDYLNTKARRIFNDRDELTLVRESPESQGFIYQANKENGVNITVAQKLLKGTDLKVAIALGYDYQSMYTGFTHFKLVSLVSEIHGFQTHLQRMELPFYSRNRSCFVTTYHKHEPSLQEYSLIRSSRGNGKIED